MTWRDVAWHGKAWQDVTLHGITWNDITKSKCCFALSYRIFHARYFVARKMCKSKLVLWSSAPLIFDDLQKIPSNACVGSFGKCKTIYAQCITVHISFETVSRFFRPLNCYHLQSKCGRCTHFCSTFWKIKKRKGKIVKCWKVFYSRSIYR